MMKNKRKVLAYITKGEEPDMELLIFEQKDEPEAGVQVPGGTVEEDEPLIDALYREITEETGITREGLFLLGKVHKYIYYPNGKDTAYERNFFHFGYVGQKTEWEHLVVSDGQDNGMTFQFRFVPFSDLPILAGEQDVALDFL
jgi:8-oxo-dGTP diphosphatase